jgi:hypothetical protein
VSEFSAWKTRAVVKLMQMKKKYAGTELGARRSVALSHLPLPSARSA